MISSLSTAVIGRTASSACFGLRGMRVNTRYRNPTRWRSLCTLYLLACQVRVTIGDVGLCCCVCVTFSIANSFPDLLILRKRFETRSVSDCNTKEL